MKTIQPRKKFLRTVAGTAAIVSIPITAWALSGSTLEVSQWGEIGYHPLYSGSNYSSFLLLVGYNNNAPSGAYMYNSMAVGSNLNIYDENSVVIGTWNEDTTGDEAFVIGNGDSSSSASNSFVVLKDGAIQMERQGDIEMGIYGN